MLRNSFEILKSCVYFLVLVVSFYFFSSKLAPVVESQPRISLSKTPKPSSRSCKQDEPPKWRKVILDYPKPRPRPKPEENPEEEVKYKSNVVLVDEMIFISAKKIEPGQEDSDNEFEYPLQQPSPVRGISCLVSKTQRTNPRLVLTRPSIRSNAGPWLNTAEFLYLNNFFTSFAI